MGKMKLFVSVSPGAFEDDREEGKYDLSSILRSQGSLAVLYKGAI